MGLFDKQKPVQDDTQQEAWLADRARIASFLYRARTFNGTGPEDPTLAITLRNGERALLVATGTYLVEPRRVQAHWAGVSGGFSFHVPLQAVQGEGLQVGPGAGLTPVDTGDLTFTDQRIVFAGAQQSREWEYSALLGFHHADHPPWTAVAITGQDHVSGFRYDDGQSAEIRFAIVLGLARFHNAVPSLISDLQEQLDEFDRIHSNAAPPAGAPQWQGQQATTPPVQAGPTGGSPAAWPPANPFPVAPTQAQAPPASEATWAGDPAHLAPSGDVPPAGTGLPANGLPANGLATNGLATPTSDTTEPPGEGPSAAESSPVGTASDQAAPDQVNEPAAPQTSWDQAGPEQAAPEGAGTETVPAGAEDAVPTGEIPAVSVSPTATYPAIQQTVAPSQAYPAAQGYPAAAEAYQAGQPYQAGPAQQTQPAQQAQPAAPGAASTPPGWYPDPWRVARVRWWDGYSWTSYTSN